MEKQMRKKYNPNEPFWLNRTIARTEQSLARDQAKLEALKIQQALNAIDRKLKLLAEISKLYSPQEAEDAQPLAVHSAPLSS